MVEIFAYDNADSLFGIFNAIVAVMGSADYASALATVAAFGFLIAFFAYAFAPERLHGWKWLATVVLVYSCIFVPRLTVGIVDKTGNWELTFVAGIGLLILGAILAFWMKPDQELGDDPTRTARGQTPIPEPAV